MKSAGMARAVALVGIGLIIIGLSNFANRAEAVPQARPAAAQVVGVVLEHGHNTGRWANRLLAVKSDGSVVELETLHPQPRWKPFDYTP